MKTCPQCDKSYDNSASVCSVDHTPLVLISGTGSLPSIGSLLAGRYRIVEKIGEGGMGTIYKAVHTMMDRTCAIKLLTKVSSHDESAVARFNREAKMASRIDNPHAVTIYDFGEAEGGLLYLAMEFIDGKPLSRILDEEVKLPLPRVVEITSQIAQALRAAHELEIVHRDLKPDNIMICSKGGDGDYVKVLDFGIAKTVTDDSGDNLTKTGFILGTPFYMSPEQLSGDRLDPRSDVYSLALIAYQMLCGRLPFEGDNPHSIMIKRLMADPIPLRLAAPGILDSVDRAVMAGLARDRDVRTPTAESFAKELSDAALVGTRVLGSRATNRLGDDLPTTPDLGPSSYHTRPDPGTRTPNVSDGSIAFESAAGNMGAAKPSTQTANGSPSIAPITPPGQLERGLKTIKDETSVLSNDQVVDSTAERRSPWLWLTAGIATLLAIGALLFYFLQPTDFTLVVKGAPPGSEVFVDDVARGVVSLDGSFRISDPKEGRWQVRIAQTGFSKFEAVVNAASGKEETITAVLLPLEIDLHGPMVLVPAGEFTMGSDEGEPSERPAHTVYLNDFYIDKFEVTNKQYKEFCDATLRHDMYPANPRSFPDYFTAYPDFPVVGISWHDAQAYVGWAGKRLPKEAEWEKAASWDPVTGKKRRWPWGDKPERTRAHLGVNSPGPAKVTDYSGDLSPYGARGMAGNVTEWVDAFFHPYPGNSIPDKRFGDEYRVTRGGAVIWQDINEARATKRSAYIPEDKTVVRAIGFRCAIDADEAIQELLRTRNTQ